MNPRIQVEHTVTECVTGIDLVRSQILVAAGHTLFGEEIAIPKQEDMPCIGFAIQCRITTEDPEKNFSPDYGRILNYRSAAGFGIRLDAASGDAGSVITPYYDSHARQAHRDGPGFPDGLPADGPRAPRVPHPRGEDEHPVPRKRHRGRDLPRRPGAHQAHRHQAGAVPVQAPPRPRDPHARLSVRHHAQRQPEHQRLEARRPIMHKAAVPNSLVIEHHAQVPRGSRDVLLEIGPEKFAQWILDEKRLLITDTTFRDAHQSLIATRMRSFDMLRVAEAVAHRIARALLAGNVGRRHLRHRDALPQRVPVGPPPPPAREDSEHLLPDALPRLERRRLFELPGQRRRRLRQARGRLRHGHLPDLRLAQLSA